MASIAGSITALVTALTALTEMLYDKYDMIHTSIGCANDLKNEMKDCDAEYEPERNRILIRNYIATAEHITKQCEEYLDEEPSGYGEEIDQNIEVQNIKNYYEELLNKLKYQNE